MWVQADLEGRKPQTVEVELGQAEEGSGLHPGPSGSAELPYNHTERNRPWALQCCHLVDKNHTRLVALPRHRPSRLQEEGVEGENLKWE